MKKRYAHAWMPLLDEVKRQLNEIESILLNDDVIIYLPGYFSICEKRAVIGEWKIIPVITFGSDYQFTAKHVLIDRIKKWNNHRGDWHLCPE